MKLVLIRHAEVIETYQGKYNGHIDIPLSKKGLEDAKLLKEQLKEYTFDAIYCSDLLRTKQTLEQLELNEEVIFTPELREKSWGKHEGMSFEAIEASGIKYETFEQWIAQLGGETLQEFQERIKKFFFHTLEPQQNKTLLIVTHSGVIKTLLGIQKNNTLQESFNINVPYGCITEIVLCYNK